MGLCEECLSRLMQNVSSLRFGAHSDSRECFSHISFKLSVGVTQFTVDSVQSAFRKHTGNKADQLNDVSLGKVRYL